MSRTPKTLIIDQFAESTKVNANVAWESSMIGENRQLATDEPVGFEK